MKLNKRSFLLGTFIGLSILAVIYQSKVLAWEFGVLLNICHKTGSVTHPWEGIQIDKSAWPAHLSHGDFPYEGPVKENNKPDDGRHRDDVWCQAHVPTVSGTPIVTPSNTITPTVSVTATPSLPPSFTVTPTTETQTTPTPQITNTVPSGSATWSDERPTVFPGEQDTFGPMK